MTRAMSPSLRSLPIQIRKDLTLLWQRYYLDNCSRFRENAIIACLSRLLSFNESQL